MEVLVVAVTNQPNEPACVTTVSAAPEQPALETALRTLALRLVDAAHKRFGPAAPSTTHLRSLAGCDPARAIDTWNALQDHLAYQVRYRVFAVPPTP